MTRPKWPSDCAPPRDSELLIRCRRNARLWLVFCALTSSLACTGSDEATFGPTGTGSGSPPTSTTAPVFSGSETREVTLRWIPSASTSVVRYELSVGESSGVYSSVIRIPVGLTNRGSDGVYSYPITVRSDVDLYMALRAVEPARVSTLSNEIRVAAVTSAPLGLGGGGHAAGASSGTTPAGSTLLGGGGSGQVAPLVGGEAAATAPTQTAHDDAAAALGGDAAAPTPQDVGSTDALASIEFDGLREYLANITPADLGIAGAFTLSMWLQPVVDEAPRRVLFDARTAPGSGGGRMTLALIDGVDLELAVRDADGEIALRAHYEFVPADARWQHLTLVYQPGLDLEPRLFVDLEPRRLLRVEPEGAIFTAPAAELVWLGGSADEPGAGFRGRIGHVAVWDSVLSWVALAEVQGRGHPIDLRIPTGAYGDDASLVHYWRLGDVDDAVGFDLGTSAQPLDLDDPAGGIAYDDIVLDGPASLVVAAPRP